MIDQPEPAPPATAIEDVDARCEEINQGILDALHALDGSTESAVALLTGIPVAELSSLGGID